MANLRLIDAEGNIYNFPESFWLGDISFNTTQSVQNIAFAHGGKNTADRFLEARNVIIEGDLRADNLVSLETAERALKKAILAGGKLYVTDDTVSRYIEVSSPQTNQSFQGDYRLEKPYIISMLAEYPFWQDGTLTEEDNIVSALDEISIDNSESDVLVYPIIEITADQGVDVTQVKMSNLSDGGMSFTYTDPNFVIGDTLEIDCIDGTVKRNGNDTIQYFSPARYLRLQNVVNTIKYEGAAATVTFKFRKVYL